MNDKLTITIPLPTRLPGWVRTHKKKSIFIAIALILVTMAGCALFQPKEPEFVTDTAKRGDLRQTVEAVGTVTSERDLELQFPVTGIVQDVLVKEGQTVRAGQVLARLKAGELAASVAAASANVASAEANLKALEQGTRPEDIAITEADVENKKAALEAAKSTLATAESTLANSQQKLAALRSEASVSLSGQIAVAASTLSIQYTTADAALSTIDDLWRDNDILDAAIKSGGAEYDLIKQQRGTAGATLQAARSAAPGTDYDKVLAALEQGRLAIAQTLDVVSRAYVFVSGLQETASFSNADREAAKSTLATEKSDVQDALNNIDAAWKALRDASASSETKIAAEEANLTAAQGTKDKALADIRTFETALRTAEAQLTLKKAGARQTDIDAARANLNQYRAALARASAEHGKTVLTAPIDGVVTKVIVKPGENLPTGPAVTILGNAPYRIEMYVSEIDVPKVQVTQSGSIELDAFRGTHFKLLVSEIDSAATDRDGVSKYRVKLDFRYPHDELKIGMTGDAEIVTGIRPDVIQIPQRAVLDKDDGTLYVRVKKEDGTLEERPVQTGMEGEGGMIEVIGVQEGETIVVLEKA